MNTNEQPNYNLNIGKNTEELYTNYEVNKAYLIAKRSIDIFGTIMGLIVSSPLFLAITLLYLFGDQKGPIFFKQKRIGKNGKLFYIYKFRSMVINADLKLKSNHDLYNKYIENNYKLEPDEDPRITKIGRFLRKTSFDELPQLLNVLKGEMSLVGPRPIVKEELEEYSNKKNMFLSVKPGMTGYWQATGRSTIGYPERVDIELYYVNHQSLVFDIKILLLTIRSVIIRKGAY
ncbi:sugar transferase [Sporolactobacillus laevolacticus]|uniref:sugar transferase n=1 Tax=Sporolactobacillus laevolacticus TaxID=33018 RepID=UPI003F490AEF